ncbi:MAG: DNA helicase RecQ [Oscillospiraceae bacterium]|jgi:ATP-dependent DNA helicase RecQ|nr:DNA helicase RecQ [Oscillospiraceae bacterium]
MHEVLKRYYGYDAFREGQEEIISALLGGRDALGVMPTGAGKSLCYQIPALLLPGITLVISPLISLMRDQVQALTANGISAAFINSSLSAAQTATAMANAREGQYKLIYIAPERLLMPSMLEFTQSADISLIAVDEVHCISQWGQDFRPSYLDIPEFVAQFNSRPVLAGFTATATPRVRDDILRILRLHEPLTLTTGFDRPNLYFEVQQPKDKYTALITYLNKTDGCGIVYCSTRKEVDGLCEKLKSDGFEAAAYHAGLPPEERSLAQDDFIYDKIRVIVATNAFGMGIDKSNVRFVVHYNMPQNIESYYQEAGRAGRDGLDADCILLYARKDINTALFLINQSENPEEIQRNRQLLDLMEKYCETYGCLRHFMLNYFGENHSGGCGNCSNCKTDDSGTTDATIDAQKILSCIIRLARGGTRLGFNRLCGVLRGTEYPESATLPKEELPTYGAMRGESPAYIRQVFNRLAELGYIALSDDVYRTASATSSAREVLFKGVSISVRERKTERAVKTVRASAKSVNPQSSDLFAKLKTLRLEIAKEQNVPAFIIFSDAALADMCEKHPLNEYEMLEVSGVGKVKLERYGERFLRLLNEEKRTIL